VAKAEVGANLADVADVEKLALSYGSKQAVALPFDGFIELLDHI
jgi:hypothetical protein